MTSPRPRPAAQTGQPALPGRRSRARAAEADRGSATLELAAGLPIVLLLLLTGLVAIAAVSTQLQCVDAARAGARAAARGDAGPELARQLAPARAEVTVTPQGDTVVAVVTAPVPLLGTRLPRATVAARAVAAVEPGHPAPPTDGGAR